ncbi:SOS response-associated peptidase family protein [Clostridium sp.]|uniref:SOS response-associated peptidase family protein n=1 Tax=Clostridium sp. TaxID=1506 RepID=UPI003464CDA8
MKKVGDIMCGRYFINLNTFKKELEMFQGERFPGEESIVITKKGYMPMKWGFPLNNVNVINARGETLMSKPLFSKSFEERTLIVPTSGFYEWKNGIKYKVKLKNNEPMLLGGIYSGFVDNKETTYNAFTVITTEANGAMAKIHHRKPIVIPKEIQGDYLNNNITIERIMDINSKIDFFIEEEQGKEQLRLI